MCDPKNVAFPILDNRASGYSLTSARAAVHHDNARTVHLKQFKALSNPFFLVVPEDRLTTSVEHSRRGILGYAKQRRL